MTVEYDGTNYSGWQMQTKSLTVQEVIEKALSDFFEREIKIHGSGRTDKGVHAKGQVAHFDLKTSMREYNIIRAINSRLPDDIKIQDLEIVDSNFHSQYDAKSKVYEYRSYVSKFPKPLLERTHARIIPKFDIELAKEKSKILLGEHDFVAFCAANSDIGSTIRNIYSFEIEQSGDEIVFTIEGDGFLYNMIRIIVGTLVFIGKGMIAEDSLEKMLKTKERKYGGKTYAAKGLCLKEVKY